MVSRRLSSSSGATGDMQLLLRARSAADISLDRRPASSCCARQRVALCERASMRTHLQDAGALPRLRFRLEDGRALNLVAEDTFEIVGTGKIVKHVPGAASR